MNAGVDRKHELIKATRRCKRRSFKPRPRMSREGMLVQFDGSEHVWFGEVKSDLIAAIDDATGKILAAEFFYGEKSMHSLKVIKEVINEIPEKYKDLEIMPKEMKEFYIKLLEQRYEKILLPSYEKVINNLEKVNSKDKKKENKPVTLPDLSEEKPVAVDGDGLGDALRRVL